MGIRRVEAATPGLGMQSRLVPRVGVVVRTTRHAVLALAVLVATQACGGDDPSARADDDAVAPAPAVPSPTEVAPSPAAPPPADTTPETPAAPFLGFRDLSVPDIVPLEIPPPSSGVCFPTIPPRCGPNFSPDGRTPSQALDVPGFTPFTVAPSLQNRDEVGAALELEYPALLREAGVGSKVEVWIHIEATGTVRRVAIHQSSGHPALDEAAIRVGPVMRFSPAMNRDQVVAVWVSIPIRVKRHGLA